MYGVFAHKPVQCPHFSFTYQELGFIIRVTILYFDNVKLRCSPRFRYAFGYSTRRILSWFLTLDPRIANLESWATDFSISNLALSRYGYSVMSAE